MDIGNIHLKHGIMLAPMAGFSDTAFRLLCREMGAEYTVSEMISAAAVHYGDKKTAALAEITESEEPMALQIFGSDPDFMAECAAALAAAYPACAIDINMGCPVRKVTCGGDGSALMKKPELAGEIIKSVTSAVRIPVTVKLRSGWDEEHKNAVLIAQLAEKNGAAAVCVHGRTKEQMYRPPVDLQTIRDVKSSVGIPVVGNGGIMCVNDALKMLEVTGCDGVMIARGAVGNPFIFSELKACLDGLPYTPPSTQELLKTAVRHLRLLLRCKGERTAVCEARSQISPYIKGITGAAQARLAMNSASSTAEIIGILESLISAG